MYFCSYPVLMHYMDTLMDFHRTYAPTGVSFCSGLLICTSYCDKGILIFSVCNVLQLVRIQYGYCIRQFHNVSITYSLRHVAFHFFVKLHLKSDLSSSVRQSLLNYNDWISLTCLIRLTRRLLNSNFLTDQSRSRNPELHQCRDNLD